MTLTEPLRTELDRRPRKPFRGISASLTAALLNHPRVLQSLFQYVLPVFQRVIDLGPNIFVVSHRDIREVMERDDDFPSGPQVGPAMVCGAFVLGTDRVPLYREDLEFLWRSFFGVVVPPRHPLPPGGTISPKPPKLTPLTTKVTARVKTVIDTAERGDGRLDLVQGLLRPVCSWVVQEHLGVGPPNDDGWAEILWDVLGSLALRIILPGNYNLDDPNNPVVADLLWARSMLQLAINGGIDAAINAASTGGRAPANIIAKMYGLLAKRKSPPPLQSIRDTIIRNISGLAITGCHPLAKAAAQAVDILLSNPAAFRGATAAAMAGDKSLFWDFIEEALRFFPPFPLVVRACPRDTVIGVDSGRPRKVRAGQNVTVGLLPAMFDAAAVPFPYQFRTDRAPRDAFLVFGRGVHACFGYQFAREMLIALLMPLFACGFARAPGREGRLSFDSVMPQSLKLRLSPPGIGAAKC